MTPAEGEYLVKLARRAINSRFSGEEVSRISSQRFRQKSGVFVSLHKRGELRGCIGFPEAIYHLEDAIVKAAIAAAFEDPRFPPLSREELPLIQIEISILTKPKLISVNEPKEYLSNIKIGRDGLIIKSKFGSGLLLPQVALEYNWTVREFLNNLCRKAMLPANAWETKEIKIYSFQAQIFAEQGNKVVELSNPFK
ncbi:MAG: TIGR00296 family protein [Candidatus Woesearchaeota archaeon]